MPDFFEVDTVILNQNISNIRDYLSQMRNRLKEMMDAVTELDSMWDGPANSEFIAQFSKDYTMFSEFCDSIGTLIESMEYASKEYDICESKVSAAVDAIKL